eukprot:TRINITY_DN6678_c0_g1_i3.p1 TRINITY_DN6678_c0_g1~~TRINITY_DN6678_c0_g1_i3.p1  ORF type:complete len:248 (-),score=53.67 TRINITY_DN6678_c0_g1_i3:454-1197(-)
MKRKELLEKKFVVDTQIDRIEFLKNKVIQLKNKISEGRSRVDLLKNKNQEKELKLQEAARMLDEYQKLSMDKMKGANQTTMELQEVRRKLADNRRRRISELMTLLPLETSAKNTSKVLFMNIYFPSIADLSRIEDTISSAALGYIVLLVSILSQYLNVQLPYEMWFMGSKSMIHKQGDINSRAYALNLQTSTMEEFKIALEQLEYNVYYLCLSQNFFFEEKENAKHFLFMNLYYLLKKCSGERYDVV